ncbi:hypothetical protein A3A64_00555 [Candidatus Gottesmanbacteria bacterium RIFCSPLOWO2_01_FULL_48_11]|uniref:Bacterial toxin RNase RnlA/LsoA DBD domain-containing protein n=2 Tax=Candidatus Gottesmaniibacteriota TaxID=1752720 RepID=A0A0G1U000_9BACT|nr:MAG: hypothetical protein UY16_C0029G0018 [Candidatus Gottesmanbacteria bacterium GW2011_GWA2_47_9]OGG28218.1 MAG: hypothetical protein A3A64_00555 [Candidatus Gottesmanbacteria bacterium RIFCSPLOWO2_01_FULL_48_11]
MIQEGSELWQYLKSEMRQLAEDGQVLIEDRKLHPDVQLSDYSYLVFPFSKLYEGFLKYLFRDLGIIEERDFRSDHFRIGKVLSPNLAQRLGGHSAWRQIEKRFGRELADRLWHTWKEGRNLLFHFFPHNYRALTQKEAEALVSSIIHTMDEAVTRTNVR